MSIQTYSGLPALASSTKTDTIKLFSDFAKGIAHLRDDPDYDLLFIPKYEDFVKFDCKNDVHPLQHALNTHEAQVMADDDERAYLDASLHLPEAGRKRRYQRLLVRQLEREATFDKSVAMKDRLEGEKNILAECIDKEDAAQQERDHSAASSCDTIDGGSDIERAGDDSGLSREEGIPCSS